MTDQVFKPLEFSYDEREDVITIEGQMYSGELFRSLGVGGFPVGAIFGIVGRDKWWNDKNVLTIHRYADIEEARKGKQVDRIIPVITDHDLLSEWVGKFKNGIVEMHDGKELTHDQVIDMIGNCGFRVIEQAETEHGCLIKRFQIIEFSTGRKP